MHLKAIKKPEKWWKGAGMPGRPCSRENIRFCKAKASHPSVFGLRYTKGTNTYFAGGVESGCKTLHECG
jgi:hypothetical protein